MAQFFGLIPINAANFESGAAGDGQVLTADGAGNAAWEDAAGGGASFSYDGATFTPGAYNVGTSQRDITITITIAGVPVVNGWYHVEFFVGFEIGGDVYATDACPIVSPTLLNIYKDSGINNFFHAATVYCGSGGSSLIVRPTNSADGPFDARIIVTLPSGGVARSDLISVPGAVT